MMLTDPVEMARHARSLELQGAVSTLFGILFPGRAPDAASAGRYALIGDLVDRAPKLKSALVEGHNPRRIPELWQEALLDNSQDVRLLHLLAVVFREQALAAQSAGSGRGHSDPAAAGPLWVASTSLWVLLLSSDQFWAYFAPNRALSRDGARRPLDPVDRDTLAASAARGVLSLHATVGARDLAAGRPAWAQIHARCLDLARSPASALVKALEDVDMVYPHAPSEIRLAGIAQIARDALDAWAQGIVREAEKEVDDPDVIKTLPEGIRKNYAGGVKKLQSFIDFRVPVARVLRTSLDWYNDWCHCLYTLQKTEEIRKLMKPACAVADQLAPLCEPGRGFDPGNQVLSTHMLLRGFVASDPAESLDHYTDALKWNDANDNARQLAAGARKQNLHERLGEAVKLIEAKKFDKAFEAIDRIGEPDDEDGRNTVRQARSAVCFRHAMALAEDGHFRKALARAKEGAALAPGEEAFTTLTHQLEELAPNEDNLRHVRAAKEAMDKDRFDDVIAHASKVDAASTIAGQARNLHSAAYFRRGIARAQREDFTDGLSDLRQALTLNENPKEQAVIRQQIHAIAQAEIGSGLKSAFEKRDWAAAETHLRSALLQSDLSRKMKKALQSQLSGVLNAEAVELANKAEKATDEEASQLDAISDMLRGPEGLTWLTPTKYGSKAGLRSFMLGQAVKKLTDAIELDPGNTAAKQNLKAIAALASRHGDYS